MKISSLHASLLLLASLGSPRLMAHTNLQNFAGGDADGASPQGSLTLIDPTLYGMTEFGGSANKGTLFKTSADGTGFSLVHTFLGGTNDGAFPLGSLTLSGSTLFGMTVVGGTGQGTIFKINTDGTGFILLHSFSPSPSDGWAPIGAVIVSDSVLFGMTQQGGSRGNGMIFKMNTDGTGFTLLHSFELTPDGQLPRGSLSLSGNVLFGMTQHGGASSSGTLFKINTDGTGYSVLHDFTSFGSDGHNPWGSLTLAGETLFGMTASGGTNSGSGTIFTINTDGSGFQVLHTFYGSRDGATGDPNDGAEPQGSLLLSGNILFGMTRQGGIRGDGVVFQINTDGTAFTLLDSFGGARDGVHPMADPTLSRSGHNLFGMTPEGGASGNGIIFSLAMNRPPVADASATPTLFLSPNGSNAPVVLDGSRSSDPDGDTLQYLWFLGDFAAPVATGIVATVVLPVGTNSISLVVSDGIAAATNTILVQVITLAQAVDNLVAAVTNNVSRSQPLIASLSAAIASIDRSNPTAAINQLRAFQEQIRAQLQPLDPDLAQTMLQASQAVIDNLTGGLAGSGPGGGAPPRFDHMVRNSDGSIRLQLLGDSGHNYTVAASTNMLDWEPIGAAVDRGNGTFEFEDTNAVRIATRFYRIISP